MPKAPRPEGVRPASAGPPPDAPEVLEPERLTPAAEAALAGTPDDRPIIPFLPTAPRLPGGGVVEFVQRHPVLVLVGATGVAAVMGLVGGLALAATPALPEPRPRRVRRNPRRRRARA